MAVKDYTARIESARIKAKSYDNLDYTPIAVPAGATIPETTQQTMARMMLSSGMISLDDYHKMIGVSYDGDYSNESEDFRDFGEREDRWKQSAFAEYEDDLEYNIDGRLETKQESSPVLSNTETASDTSNAGNTGATGQDTSDGNRTNIPESSGETKSSGDNQ